MTEQKLFSFTDDFVFKWIFGRPKNERLLMSLLNALMQRRGKSRITSLTLLNPFNLKELDEGKLSIVDVKAKDVVGRHYLIEVQVKPR